MKGAQRAKGPKAFLGSFFPFAVLLGTDWSIPSMASISGVLPLSLHHHIVSRRPNTLLFSARIPISESPLISRSKSKKPTATFAVGGETDLKQGDMKQEQGHPGEFYSEEWQAEQREKSKQWQAYRHKEEELEKRKMEEYREIGTRLKGYSEEETRKARILVSTFIQSAEEVEEKIEEAGERGELTELVLMVVLNRLDVARRDGEKDAIRSLDLLYRRIETEILKRESSPSMRLLNELLNLHDGFDDDGWVKKCRKLMVETFPREDPFSILVPPGFDMDNKQQGRIRLPEESDQDDIMLRVDFVREVDELLQEVKAGGGDVKNPQGLDPESVATQLKQQERQRTIFQVEALLELAVNLQW